MRLLRLYQLRLGLWLCRSAIERLNRALGVVRYAYSVPWRLIGERVRVTIAGGVLRVHHAGRGRQASAPGSAITPSGPPASRPT